MQTKWRYKKTPKYLAFLLIAILVPSVTHSHCPLCTAGAGILALIAASLGVPALIIATLLGGFALAMGLWFGNLVKKKYFRFQDQVIAWGIYVLTVAPLWPVLKEYKILYMPWFGIDKYAKTIPVDIYILGVVLGAVLLLVTPYISKQITKQVGKQIIPFQGIIITMVLLVLIPLLIDIFFLV